MLAPAKTLTWEEFEKLPDDGMHHELLEGELITLPPPKAGHGRIAHRVRDLLVAPGKSLGRALIEAGYKLSEDPPTWVQPDVSFLSLKRFLETREDEYFQGAPELAVGIISPSESAADIDEKVFLMLAAGARTIWVIYPRTHRVVVYEADGSISPRIPGQVLTADILPGFELPVEHVLAD